MHTHGKSMCVYVNTHLPNGNDIRTQSVHTNDARNAATTIKANKPR